MQDNPFRCHDLDACQFGQTPCPTPDACGIKEEWKPLSFWKQVLAVFNEPSCCETNGVSSCQQGRDCPTRKLYQIEEPKK